MTILIKLLVNGIGVYLTDWLLEGVFVEDFLTAVVVAMVFALVNTFIKPLILLLTFPITLLTLGLFKIVINAGLILLVASLIEGFTISSFFQAILFSLVYSLISTGFSLLAKD